MTIGQPSNAGSLVLLVCSTRVCTHTMHARTYIPARIQDKMRRKH